MSKPYINTDAEEVLIYLSKTERQIERTKHAIREACHLADAIRADVALRQLLQSGYITNVNDGEYQLTPAGKQAARKLGTSSTQIINFIDTVEGGTIGMTGTQEAAPLDSKHLYTAALTLPDDDDGETTDAAGSTLIRPPEEIPTLYHHPLRRANALLEAANDRRPNAVLRYLLAFDMPKDALPIPVLHGDILGRSRSAHICLRHDDYISTRHCRFEIRQESGAFKLYVEDLGSRNGTYIDKSRLKEHKRYVLKHGSYVQVGNTVLIAVQIP